MKKAQTKPPKMPQGQQSENCLTASFMMVYPFSGVDASSFQKVTLSENISLEKAWRNLNSEDEVFEFSKRLIDERLGLAMKILAEQSS